MLDFWWRTSKRDHSVKQLKIIVTLFIFFTHSLNFLLMLTLTKKRDSMSVFTFLLADVSGLMHTQLSAN